MDDIDDVDDIDNDADDIDDIDNDADDIDVLEKDFLCCTPYTHIYINQERMPMYKGKMVHRTLEMYFQTDTNTHTHIR